MKKFLVMAAMVLSSVGAFAQYEGGEFTIQPKVGLNMSTVNAEVNIPAASISAKGQYVAGFVGGVEAEYHFNKLLGLSFGALYSQEGAKYDQDDLHLLNGDVNIKLGYINVPVLVNFYVAKGLALKVGIQPGFKVSSKAKLGGTELNNMTLAYNYSTGESTGMYTKFETKSVNLSIPIGISYEYANVCLDARFNAGATETFKAETGIKTKSENITLSTFDGNNLVFQLTLGYKFKL